MKIYGIVKIDQDKIWKHASIVENRLKCVAGTPRRLEN
jgi:hypothetical protein